MDDNTVINRAYEDFMMELFGSMPEDITKKAVKRTVYKKAMHEVQNKYGLKQGHPDFAGWIFTLLGNSPMIIEDEEEGADHNEYDGRSITTSQS